MISSLVNQGLMNKQQNNNSNTELPHNDDFINLLLSDGKNTKNEGSTHNKLENGLLSTALQLQSLITENVITSPLNNKLDGGLLSAILPPKLPVVDENILDGYSLEQTILLSHISNDSDISNLLLDPDSTWNLSVFYNQIDTVNNSTSSDQIMIGAKLFLWGSAAKGNLSQVGGVDDTSRLKEADIHAKSESSPSLNNKSLLRVDSFQKVSAANNISFSQATNPMNTGIIRITQELKLNLLKISPATSLLLDLIQPKRIQITGESSEMKLWIRDYLTAPKKQLEMIKSLITELPKELGLVSVYLNGQKINFKGDK